MLVLADTKTGKSIRPLGAAAIAILASIVHRSETDFVFPAERGEGHYQVAKQLWSKITLKAGLPGVRPIHCGIRWARLLFRLERRWH